MSSEHEDRQEFAEAAEQESGSESKPDLKRKRKKRFDQIIYYDWCKGCGLCSAFCPRQVYSTDKLGRPIVQRPDDCIGCQFCELHCPDFAITIKQRAPGKRKKNAWSGKRK